MFTKITALLLSGLNALLVWVGWPKLPAGQRLDMDKFELTWQDEFDGTQLDSEKWRGHFWGVPDSEGQSIAHPRRDGWWALDVARVEGGKLCIPSFYSEEGIAGGPAGYYSLGIDTRGLFEQTFGYFEARCKLPKGEGLWSAFWMMPHAFGAEVGDGRTGAEVDIYEGAYHPDPWPKKNSVSSAIHMGGYGENQRSTHIGRFHVRRPYDSFHTYGIEWNADEYIFYIDGRETGRSDFGGVCQNPLYLLLSVEHVIGGWSGDITNNKPGDMTDFVIDYVRAYQYKELLEVN